MMYEIHKNVPVPVRSREKIGRPSSYPFATMDVGDSFFVPLNGESAKKVKHRIQSSSRQITKETKRSFQYHDLGDKIGVWRMPDRETARKAKPRTKTNGAGVHADAC